MWTPEPPGVGYEVDGYTVTTTGPNLVVPQTCTGATTCFVGGLTNGIQYSVTVQAYVTVYGDLGKPLGNEPVGGSSPAVMAIPTTAQNCSYVGESANLQGCDLSGANLIFVNLTGANLTGANLTGATMNGALLNNANLTNTILNSADLTGANLTDTNLTDANLTGADLSGVYSGGITGTPANLPPGWSLDYGYLIGPHELT